MPSAFYVALMLTFILYFSVECQGELSNSLNECFVVDGSMTLYSTFSMGESFLDGIRDIIQKAMDEGDYNEIDPRLIKVSYREDLETTGAVAGTGNTTQTSGGSSSLPPYAWAIIGVGASIVLVALAAAFNKRRQHNPDGSELGSFPDQAIDEHVV